MGGERTELDTPFFYRDAGDSDYSRKNGGKNPTWASVLITITSIKIGI